MKEINILDLLRKASAKRKSLWVCLSCGTAIGIIVALAIPKIYKSEVLLAPEMASGGLGLSENLADMASSFGIDLGSTGKSMDALYPEIYPEILSSYDFISTLFNVKVRLKEDQSPRTYYHHMLKEQKIPFWEYPGVWLTEMTMSSKERKDMKGNDAKDPFRTSKINMDVAKAIGGNISCLIDKKTSVILVSVEDQDPMVAAIIADTIQSRLQDYITKYRTKKARNDVAYYTKLYEEAKKAYKKAQYKYVSYCDADQDVVLESFQAKRDELENEMQLAFNLMNQMSTQVQTAKAKVQERTPAYTVISSPKMQYRAASMSRSKIVLIFIFLSFVANAFWVLFLKEAMLKKKSDKQ